MGIAQDILSARPRPLNFILWAAAVGYIYDASLRQKTGSYDMYDFGAVLIATWLIRKVVRGL